MRVENRIVIAGDLETGEEYLSRIVDDGAHGHDPPPNPIVEILRVVKYPHQHAIAHPETAAERPAIGAGTLCRLSVIRDPTDGERALLDSNEAEALGLALDKAMKHAESDQERDILIRHAAGEYGRRRVIITFTKSDLDYYKKNQRMEAHGLPKDMGELPGGH